MIINYNVSVKNNFKIGLVDQNNFNMLNYFVAKPWHHIANIGFGGLLAQFYYEMLVFRRIDSESVRKNNFPIIFRMVKSHVIGICLIVVGFGIICLNLFGT